MSHDLASAEAAESTRSVPTRSVAAGPTAAWLGAARATWRQHLALMRTELAALRHDRARTRLVAALVAIPAAALAGGGAVLATARGGDAAAADGFEQLVGLVLGGFGFGVAALVMAATFAIGLRRRRRELALIAANGATTMGLVAALSASAMLVAGSGAVLGVAFGLVVAAALAPSLDTLVGAPVGALRVSLAHTAAALAFGPLAALVAVAGPAWCAARIPVRVALGGRAPAPRTSAASVAVGLVALTLAAVWLAGVRPASQASSSAALAVLGASLLALCGLGALCPGLLAGLARLAGPLPLAWRLAARDAGRFCTRHGAVVTAIFASLAVAIAVGALGASVDTYVREHTAGTAQVERAWLDLALALCLAAAALVVGVATALATAEARDDTHTLHTLGASPRALAGLVAARAGLLAALGGALAVPAGLAPSYGLLALADVPLVFEAPFGTLALILIAYPAATYCAAGLIALARSRGD